ncbi:MAG: hypothetical protein WBX16_10845 [Candidatus Acidiferrales bacterium]
MLSIDNNVSASPWMQKQAGRESNDWIATSGDQPVGESSRRKIRASSSIVGASESVASGSFMPKIFWICLKS